MISRKTTEENTIEEVEGEISDKEDDENKVKVDESQDEEEEVEENDDSEESDANEKWPKRQNESNTSSYK